MVTRRRGGAETRRRGDAETRGHGDTETRRHGDAETRRSERNPQFFTTMNAQIETQSLEAWKSYLRWRALHDAAPWLSDPFVQENFNFFSGELLGQKEIAPRWKRCTRAGSSRITATRLAMRR